MTVIHEPEVHLSGELAAPRARRVRLASPLLSVGLEAGDQARHVVGVRCEDEGAELSIWQLLVVFGLWQARS